MIMKMKFIKRNNDGRQTTKTIEFKTRTLSVDDMRDIVEMEQKINTIGNIRLHIEVREEIVKESSVKGN